MFPCGFYSARGFSEISVDVFIPPVCTIQHHRVVHLSTCLNKLTGRVHVDSRKGVEAIILSTSGMFRFKSRICWLSLELSGAFGRCLALLGEAKSWAFPVSLWSPEGPEAGEEVTERGLDREGVGTKFVSEIRHTGEIICAQKENVSPNVI